ncbi:MAG: glycosyltransferase [Planctomycetes bacterium]|nr:glycosyltransferase [Planctomycetota bacterium]
MLPLVSVVTPSFNQGRFLRRTIESVLGQDYPRLEYLVFDGGSSDESVEILRTYGDRFFWRSGPDGGQSDAINRGLGRAQGEILAYLNSDDVLLPGAITTIVEYFRQHPEWDLVYGNAGHIDEADGYLGAYPTAPYSFERLVQDCCICQPAAFWRRAVVERIGPFDESLHYAMDYEYWMRLDRAGGRLAHVPEFLACSRTHAATKTLSARLNVYREILQVSRRHAGDASFSQYYAYWHHRCHERQRGWPRLLRWLPECQWYLAYVHRRAFRLLGAALAA